MMATDSEDSAAVLQRKGHVVRNTVVKPSGLGLTPLRKCMHTHTHAHALARTHLCSLSVNELHDLHAANEAGRPSQELH